MVTLLNPLTLTPSFMAPAIDHDTTFVFFFVANDGRHFPNTLDRVEVTVRHVGPAVNRPPTANASASQVVQPDAQVTLNGNGSSDPDSDPLSYEWSQVGGPNVDLSDVASPQPTFVAPNSRSS
jgi:hypothetical protein